ncbi:MAG: NADH-quinone oxidoreductase subunit N [Deltaproteobacteria bacterium]|nr:NADH-quinone oxidoreductase subunit N [Deltaproteobacteria bacterium]
MQVLENSASFQYFLPEMILGLTLLVVLILDLNEELSKSRLIAPWTAAVGIILYVAVSLMMRVQLPAAITFHGMMANDSFTDFFRVFSGASALLAVFLSVQSKELQDVKVEYWILLLGITLGMPVLAGANNLLMIYLAMEMVSILSYIVVGYLRKSRQSSEAALKYVLYGATASGIMIYGLSIIFGVAGSLDVLEIQKFLINNPVGTGRIALFVGLLMTLAGFGYKISAVPFHMWAPDVYQGAPTPVTAFLSVGPKAAGFAILLRFTYTALAQFNVDTQVFTPLKYLDITGLMAVLAVLTMTVGNFLAIQQTNTKRFLAYSSIAHAGYMLIAAATLSTLALQGVLFYLVAYFIMNMGAFAVTIMVINATGSEELSSFKGLAKRSGGGALIAMLMAVFMFSLVGLPPTFGFVGKFYLFMSVIKAKLYWLAVIGVINSVVSLYYYLRVVKYMYFDEAEDEKSLGLKGFAFPGVVTSLGLVTLILGIYWEPIAVFVQESANMILK